MQRKLKPKKCAVKSCRKEFIPYNSIQKWCSVDCGIKLVEQKKQEEYKKTTTKMRREFLKTDRKHQMGRATRAFNSFIRERDKGLSCISCGRNDIEVQQTDGWKTGGAWDCGHYLSVGSHPELRFEPLNAWRQCKNCNGGAGNYTRKNRTVQQDYRERLIDRIGLESVEWLEGPHDAKRYTPQDLSDIADEFNQKRRLLSSQ